jgi:hypothetical protein
MDRITHQSPRQQGYGSTSSLRNDSLKHTRKHEGKEGGIEPKSKAARLWWTVRPGGADCPHEPRGLSAKVPRTVRTGTADRPAWAADYPFKPTEPPVANPEKRTVREEHADRPPVTHGLSAPLLRTVRNFVQPKLKTKMDRKRSRPRTRRTRDELSARGLSASPTRTVRPSRTEPKTARPRRSTPPTHHRISQTVKLEKRTVREEHADRPPGTPDCPHLCCGQSETSSNQNSKPKWIESEADQEHEEHAMNSAPADCPPAPPGLSAPHGQNQKLLDPEGQLPQLITGSPKQ